MPTPHGSRGGMAFSANELRVLRCALANALQPTPVPDQTVRECLLLAQAVDEVRREADRLRAFLAADLTRYRAALPGSATGYLERLQEALDAGHAPTVEDLTALRSLCAERTGPYEWARRTELRTQLQALPGGLAADKGKEKGKDGDTDKEKKPEKDKEKEQDKEKAEPKPGRTQPPAKPAPAAPSRPVPTPAEVFPPRRRPAPRPKENAGRRYVPGFAAAV